MSDTPRAEQIEWRERVRKSGSIISGIRRHCEIHHPAGRTARHDGQAIGHWYILPLLPDEHILIGGYGPIEIKDRYYAYQGDDDIEMIEPMSVHEFEKFLFDRQCRKTKPPFSVDMYGAIQRWRR